VQTYVNFWCSGFNLYIAGTRDVGIEVFARNLEMRAFPGGNVCYAKQLSLLKTSNICLMYIRFIRHFTYSYKLRVG
jgi:hypothetical protein